jgi:hypothetical protein
MHPTRDQLLAVLSAAESVLSARVDGMLTAEEWTGLARSVADATGTDAESLLTERDLEQPRS